jgi:hypothetical protein
MMIGDDDDGWWGPLVYHQELNSTDPTKWSGGPFLTADGLTLYFHQWQAATNTNKIVKAHRDIPEGAFTVDGVLDTLGNAANKPCLSVDGNRLYFGGVTGSEEAFYLKMAQWNPTTSQWDLVKVFTEIHVTGYIDNNPTLTEDELTVFWNSNRPGGLGGVDLWMATRSTVAEPFSNPVNITELNSVGNDYTPCALPDGLTIYFCRQIPSGSTYVDIYRAVRTAVDQPFGSPQLVPGFSDPVDSEYHPFVSADEQTMFLLIDPASGGAGIYESHKE